MEKESSFFDRLTFDPKLHQGFIATYFGSIRTIILIILTLSGAGLATFFNLPKELNPNIQIPIVFVTTPFPGAGPEDIENLVTIPIEDAVSGLSGVQKVSSTSQENISSLSIEFNSGTDPQKAKSDVQSAIDSVTDLPKDADTPKIQVLDFQNQPLMVFALSGDTDTETLKRFSTLLEHRLKDLPNIEKVSISYRNDPDIIIVLKPEIIREKNLDIVAISQSIATAINNYPAGNLSTDTTVFALTQKTFARSVQELRALPLSLGNTVLTLGEVATVKEEPTNNAPEAYYADAHISGKRAIAFSIFKTDEADATTTAQSILETTTRLNATYDNAFIIDTTFDGAKEIKKSFDQLFHDFAVTILLVFTVLFTFFGLRQSIIAALAIPLTFLGTFLVMAGSGISINFIALFSLLLALGILVDNAIVIISAMASYERTKKFTPDETALLVWRDFRAVIFTTTITTVWAFLPLLLATGIIGEFIKPIPIVVSASLAISAVIALLIVIPMMAMLLKGAFPRRVIITLYIFIFLIGVSFLYFLIPAGSAKIPLFIASLIIFLLLLKVLKSFREKIHLYEESHFTKFFRTFHKLSGQGVFSLDHFAHRYERFISSILVSKRARTKTLIALIIFSICSYALVPLGYVVNEFFPQDNQDLVYVSVELPKSTTLLQSKQEILELLDTFRTYPDVRFVYAEIGATPPADNGPQSAQEYSNLLFTFILTPAKEREKTSGQIMNDLNQKFGNYNRGTLSASQVSGGPPAGSDLQLKLLGEDLPTLQKYAKQINEYLKQQEGVTNVATSIVSGSSKIVYVPNKEKFAQENINEDRTAFLLRTLGSGFTIKNDARFGDDKRDVILRMTGSNFLEDPKALGTLSLPVQGKDLPLLSLGDFVLEPNPTLITREDQKRTLSVTASVVKGYSISTLNKNLETFADTLKLPDNYSWKTGGVNDENNKSVSSILQAMLLSAALIFGTMAIQFNSFRKALIVLMVIPLAVSGVFILFALTGTPLSFPALIGILALFGIVVNNSIIMVDKINRNMDAGLPLNQAISEGAASRLEPILLTALTTIVGLIPITLSDPIWQGLGGAIIAGLTFSGIAKLFFIPVIYRAWFAPVRNTEVTEQTEVLN
jgi:HAE1 family hydrophobic/amphiphilic exporter-1